MATGTAPLLTMERTPMSGNDGRSYIEAGETIIFDEQPEITPEMYAAMIARAEMFLDRHVQFHTATGAPIVADVKARVIE